MRLLDDSPVPSRPPSARRLPFLAAAVAVVLLAAGAVVVLQFSGGGQGSATPAPQAAARRATTPAPARTGALEVSASVPRAEVSLDGRSLGPAPQSLAAVPAGPHRVGVVAEGYDPWEQATQVMPGMTTRVRARLLREAARLRVESDVAGASVFLDRRFRGKTPLEIGGLTPGAHQLNVSAEGQDPHAETLDLRPGLQLVEVQFREIHLDESLDVVHRHTFGSCSGRLVARGTVLRYETDNAKHAFETTLAAIERVEVDYLHKNLTLKLRNGRKYNFTIKGPNADPLLVFQQKVDHARARLRGQV